MTPKSRFGAEQRRRKHLAREVEFNRNALILAQQQYAAGITDVLNVLSAERNELSAKQSLATSTATVSTDLVSPDQHETLRYR